MHISPKVSTVLLPEWEQSSVLTENLHTHLKSALLLECLEVLVDDRHREQNTSTRANCTEEVATIVNAPMLPPNAAAMGMSSKLFYLHVTVALDDHLLLLELLSYISGGGASDFDQVLENNAQGEHEGDVEDGGSVGRAERRGGEM